MADDAKIIYTLTDEAPALATRSLLPIIQTFAGAAGVTIETRDISLAARIAAHFPERLTADQATPDALAELGDLTQSPLANIIKLPNISASVPQIKEAVAELQAQGYDIPAYPDEPSTDAERDIRARFDAVKGSAVNPVLREGNSDRRAPGAVKAYARKYPHSMGAWSTESKTHVTTMGSGDFQSSERSVTVEADDDVRIEHVAADGTVTVLKKSTPLMAGEIIDAAVMSHRALVDFLTAEVADARESGVLFSVHLKATMMKVSDPIIFGHVVRAYFAEMFSEHGEVLDGLGFSPNDGLATLDRVLADADPTTAAAIEASLAAGYEAGPPLAMVDSDKGITNLHVPSDVIIDASMPAMIRTSGQMWNSDGEQQDTKCVIPDSSYASLYDETIKFCQANGAFDPTTMGTVPNVGLMAQKAEEYGSHDKTFEIEAPGIVRVVDRSGRALLEHDVDHGDIWRMCQTKDIPVRDWVKLAVNRARATGWPAVFWLDEQRSHDAELLKKVTAELDTLDTAGLTIEVSNVAVATRYTLERAARGENTISVTGNVLRDYLTDLFPILELGTSAKMLSIVPLINGGGLFETGAGGSAPKHVQQFNEENHLRWDSLGEFLALAVSLEHLSETTNNPRAAVLGATLDSATEKLLDEGRSPSRKVDELDNRGSHFYLALYWAEALAAQSDDAELAAQIAPLARSLRENEESIVDELIECQGEAVDIGGYYSPDSGLADAAMRPSETLNRVLAAHLP